MVILHNGEPKRVKQVLLSGSYLFVQFYDYELCYQYEKERYAEYAYKALNYYLKTRGHSEILENDKVKFVLKRASTVYSTYNQALEVSVHCKKCHNIIPYISDYCPKCGIPLKDEKNS